MSKIRVTTNISILTFVSTCNQSEPMAFWNNGVIHIRGVVFFFKMIRLRSQPYLYLVGLLVLLKGEILNIVTLLKLTLLLQKICQSKSNSTKNAVCKTFGYLDQSQVPLDSTLVLVRYKYSIIPLELLLWFSLPFYCPFCHPTLVLDQFKYE